MISSKFPIYQCWNNEAVQQNNGMLFHYTTFECFISIIKTMSLRSSRISKLNDMNEGNLDELNIDKNLPLIIESKRFVGDNCRVVCFSINYKYDGVLFEGYNHPAMWAHYADNLEGVCIVINENKFRNRNHEVFENYFVRFGNVNYGIINAPEEDDIDYDLTSPQEFIEKNWKKLFLRKHKDWEYEGERRLFIMNYEDDFSIEGCIESVILGNRMVQDESKIRLLLEMLIDPHNHCYHDLVPASFATVMKGPVGYYSCELGSLLFDKVREYKGDYNSYLEWLYKVGYVKSMRN